MRRLGVAQPLVKGRCNGALSSTAGQIRASHVISRASLLPKR